MSGSRGGGGPGSRLPTSRIVRPNTGGGMMVSGSKSNTQSPEPTPLPDAFIIGDRVWVSGTKPGTILFIGETQFAEGEWAGVLLDDSSGKNDGTVQGVRYFQCPPNRGLFARLSNLRREPKPLKASTGANGDSSEGTPSEVGSLVSPVTSHNDDVTLPPFRHKTTGLLMPKTIPVGTSGEASQPSNNNNNNSGGAAGTNTSASQASVALGVPAAGDLRVGDRVVVLSGSRAGTLRFLGTTEFAKGSWAGVELDDATGKNDGSVAGKRYFACKPSYGLFAPVHKVVKAGAARGSASSRKQASGGPPGGAKTAGGLRSRSGSQESVSSVGSNFSSASRTRVKLGVTALSNNQRSNNNAGTVTTATANTQRRSSTSSATTSTKAISVTALQKVLREKEEHIEQLLRERDLERSEVARAAAHADELDARRAHMQQEQSRVLAEADERVAELERRLAESERQRQALQISVDDERRRVEELQFEMEEENIDKTTLESKTEADESRIFELEESVANEKERVSELEEKLRQLKEAHEGEKARAREAEESAVMHLEEVEALRARLSNVDQAQARDRSLTDEVRTQLEAKDAQLRRETERAEAAERAGKELQRSVQLLSEEKANLTRRKAGLEAQLAELGSRVDALEAQRCSAQEEVREGAARLRAVEGELAVATQRADALAAASTDLQAQLTAASQAKAGDDDAAKAEMRRLSEQVADGQRALTSAQEAQSRADNRLRQLEAQLKEAEGKHQESVASLESSHQLQVRSLQEKMDELMKKATADLTAAESRHALALASHKDEVAAERATAEAKAEALGKQLTEKEAEVSSANLLADQLREQLEEQAGAMDEVKREKSRLELSLRTAETDRADLIQAKRAAVEDREKLASNILAAEEEMSGARQRVDALSKERDAAVEEKSKALVAATEMKARSAEIQMRVDCLTKEKADLETRLTATKEELDAKSADAESAAKERIVALEKEVKESCEAQSEMRQYNTKLEAERNSLVTEINKLKSIMDEKSRLQKERDELQGQLKEMRHKCSHIESVNAKVQEQLSEKGNELRLSRDQLIALTREHEALKGKHRQSLETKEKERRRLEEKIRTMEHKLKEESKKLAAMPKPTGNAKDDAARRLQDAKENAEQQIDFLNSVIVELQTKNVDLTRQLQLLSDPSSHDSANGNDESLLKTSLPPRLYCDICEQFDIHDTEECPTQMSTSVNSKFHGARDADRPYCDACEMFDHWTHECDDQVTF